MRWWFRGVRDQAHWPIPRVRREYTLRGERYLTQEFRARAGTRYARCPRYDDHADWLALMQHYRLPTRLLDWSHSAIIAAFFAVEPAMPHMRPYRSDGANASIWVLDATELNERQGLERLLYPLNAGDVRHLVEDAFRPRRGRYAADARRGQEVAAALAVESEGRMQAQRGAFTVHASEVPLNRMPGCDSWLRQLVIPNRAIPELARELVYMGVGVADLFPDLEHLALDMVGRIPPGT